MNISRRTFLAGASGLAAAAVTLDFFQATALGATQPTNIVVLSPVKLRGYGTISARFAKLHSGRSSLTVIRCESAEKARLVQAKYLTDLTRLPGARERVLEYRGEAVPIRETYGGGCLACCARLNEVFILASDSDDSLRDACRSVAGPPLSAVEFSARATVPMYLDRWDRFGVLMYYEPFTTTPEIPWPGDSYDYASDLKFARDNETGLVIWDKVVEHKTPEGMANTQWWAWVQQTARRMKIPVHLNTANAWPAIWLSNRFRDETQLRMPQFMGGYYDIGGESGSQAPISWCSQAGEDALLGALQQTVKRFAGDPNIVGWMEPHGETSLLPMSLFCEYGPVADQSLQLYLKEAFSSLTTVSRRWTGDPQFYKSWNEIRVPEIAEFAGFGPQAIDLQGVWRVKYVTDSDGKPTNRVTPEWYQPIFDDSGWDEFSAPGNDRMMTMERNPLVYRRTVEIAANWLVGQTEVSLYVWELPQHATDELVVYINGIRATGESRGGEWHRWVVLNVTKLLKPGSNLVVIKAPAAAINYRTYLTTAPPRQYPELGPFKNAQWADFNNWTLWSRKAQMRRGVEMIRQIDRDSSVNFMAPNDDMGPVTSLCKEYGGRFHDTGAMAGFWTEEDSLMMAGAGLPTSAEPGNGAPNVRDFQSFWGRWLTEGVNGVHYFQHLGQIMWNPSIRADFEKNRRMYEAIGKFHVPFAEVGVLYSTRNHRLTTFPWDATSTGLWQAGGYYSSFNVAGELLSFCPRAGISERDLNASLVQKFSVVLDTNSSFLSDEDVAGIESYIRAGGVFITTGETGRHSEIEPNSWNISRLTGYAVVNPKISAALSLAPEQNIVDRSKWTPYGATGLSLRKIAADCRDLMHWNDGSVAAGMRPLGKGWIIQLGPFWGLQSIREQLLVHFGVRNRVPATVVERPGLKFRHYIGNTGVQDVWVLYNDSDAPLTTDLTFASGVHPASLTDIVSGAPVSISREAHGDTVRAIALAGHETVMYTSPRENLAASPLEWLSLQRGWWQGTRQPSAKHLPSPAEQQRFTLDLSHNWAFKRVDGLTDEQTTALAQPAVVDHEWERRNLDVWLTPNNGKAKRILVRRKFVVPHDWMSGRVFLSTGDSKHSARTFVDGKALRGGKFDWDGISLDDVNGELRPGTTHTIAQEVISSSEPIGFTGPTWLTYFPDPKARQELAGQWESYSTGLHSSGPITIPSTASGVAFLSRTVVIDNLHKDDNVVVYTNIAVDAILINGYRIINNSRTSDHQHNWFNVTPLVQFGMPNKLELSMSPSSQSVVLGSVEIRFYDKSYFP